jgi:hypothetical protein
MRQFIKTVLFILWLGLLTAVSGIAGVPDWKPPQNMQYTMTVHAKVNFNGSAVEANGSMLAAFKNDRCRGVVSVASGPSGKWFQLTVASDEAAESGFVLKIYDASADQVYCVKQSFAFTVNKIIGTINAPETYTSDICNPSGIILKITPETLCMTEGMSMFDVDVGIENVTDLGAFQFDVCYDSALIAVENESSIVVDSFLGSTGRAVEQPIITVDNNSGKTNVLVLSTGNSPGPNGNGILAKIKFAVKGLLGSQSTLSLTGVQITRATYPFPNLQISQLINSIITHCYIIKAGAGTDGSLTPLGDVVLKQGESKTFTITPNTGYQIADVTVDGNSKGAVSSYTFSNVNENHTITATFVLKSCTVEATAGSGGSIVPSGSAAVNCGSNQTFTVRPDACRRIADVKADGKSVIGSLVFNGDTASYTFTNINENHTIDAVFAIKNYTIQAEADAHCSISPSGAVTVECGSNKTFTITSDESHEIKDVIADGKSLGAVAEYVFSNISADHSIHATTEDVRSIQIIISGGHGTISPSGDSSGNVTVVYGQDQLFSIMPENCYKIQDVRVDGQSVLSEVGLNGDTGSYTLKNVTDNHTIIAIFTVKIFTVELLSEGKGAGILSGEIISADSNETEKLPEIIQKAELSCGNEIKITAQPDECSIFARWSGDISGTNNVVLLENILSNKAVTAIFDPIQIQGGDVNRDGDVTMKDAILSLQAITDKIVSFGISDDINGDGNIGMEEALFLLRTLQTDNNKESDLTDVISILSLLSGINKAQITTCADINRDRKIGIEEVIYILRFLAAMR